MYFYSASTCTNKAVSLSCSILGSDCTNIYGFQPSLPCKCCLFPKEGGVLVGFFFFYHEL